MPNLYFAYGSNMEKNPMRERCPQAIPLGLATLPGWAFRINDRGFATLAPTEFRTVRGLLWHLTDADEAALDDYEGVSEGLYTKCRLTVFKTGGEPVEAMIYLAARQQPGTPLPGYLESILAAAAELGLPPDYLEELGSWRR